MDEERKKKRKRVNSKKRKKKVMDKKFENIYYNLSDPRAYTGVYKILKIFKYTAEKIIYWLEGQDPYTQH